jgi:hypothetical protein
MDVGREHRKYLIAPHVDIIIVKNISPLIIIIALMKPLGKKGLQNPDMMIKQMSRITLNP